MAEIKKPQTRQRTTIWRMVHTSTSRSRSQRCLRLQNAQGIYDGANPMTGVTIPKGKKHGRKHPAYTLEEVEKHLELFSGHAPDLSSLRGRPLHARNQSACCPSRNRSGGSRWSSGGRNPRTRRWEDDDGDVLNIRRSVWRTHLNEETKTHEDEDEPGVVPIIEPLRGLLDAIKPGCCK